MEVFEGDARNILCEAVDKHHASLLVVGNHGHGAIKRSVNKLIIHLYMHVSIPLKIYMVSLLISELDNDHHHLSLCLEQGGYGERERLLCSPCALLRDDREEA